MKRKEQELLERAEGNESWETEPADKQAYGLEDEFDPEFWIEVLIKLNEFFFDFGLCYIDIRKIVI